MNLKKLFSEESIEMNLQVSTHNMRVWERIFKQESLRLKLYMSDEWTKQFGGDEAALQVERTVYAWGQFKHYEDIVKNWEDWKRFQNE
jgi:hypothetical protein